MDYTLIFLLILLHVSCSTTTTTVSISDSSDNYATWALPCRRCKFYIKVSSGGAPIDVDAPPETNSTENKPNVGVVAGLTVLLLFIVGFIIVCAYWNRRSASSVIAVRRPAVAQSVQSQVRAEMSLTESQAQTSDARSHETDEVAGDVVESNGNGDDQERRRRVQVKKVARLEDGSSDGDVVRPKKPNVVPVEGQGRDEKEEVAEEVVEPKQDEVRHHGRINVMESRNGVQVDIVVGGVVIEQGFSVGLLKKYSYKYMKRVTNNFQVKNRIGGGGFGDVYRGRLMDGTIVAVKCLKCEGVIDDFKNEVNALGRADHPNLVELIGYCDEGTNRMLVYEYLSNGSLDNWIFHTGCSRSLAWPEMKNIIQGIAQGIEYLHEKCDKKILHRDLKPSNVILDDNKNAKLCDFGLAKLMDKDQSSTSTLCLGTRQYMPPEALRYKRITTKFDVYSFGILVLEVLFGKRFQKLVNPDETDNEVIKLPDLIKNLGEDMRRNAAEIEEFGKLAKHCISEKPGERPTMSVVIATIHDLEASFKVPKA